MDSIDIDKINKNGICIACGEYSDLCCCICSDCPYDGTCANCPLKFIKG
ncbi:MAG: hypothetical protein LBU89_09380 [Fibromonadaceae bacterium]|jgi:hypothetical protein|nr:hypothetical protein [Fibromonadaceae bacterium]